MAIKVICAWCGQWMGLKPSKISDGKSELVSHSICLTCKKKVMNETKQYLKQTTANHEKNVMERSPLQTYRLESAEGQILSMIKN